MAKLEEHLFWATNVRESVHAHAPGVWFGLVKRQCRAQQRDCRTHQESCGGLKRGVCVVDRWIDRRQRRERQSGRCQVCYDQDMKECSGLVSSRVVSNRGESRSRAVGWSVCVQRLCLRLCVGLCLVPFPVVSRLGVTRGGGKLEGRIGSWGSDMRRGGSVAVVDGGLCTGRVRRKARPIDGRANGQAGSDGGPVDG
jgi:hypothetical protein